jgi:hypothetical protein
MTAQQIHSVFRKGTWRAYHPQNRSGDLISACAPRHVAESTKEETDNV